VSFCSECGKELGRTAKFCDQCGTAASAPRATPAERNREIEYLSIEAEEGGMAIGASVFMNIVAGAPSISKCRFLLRVSSPGGSPVIGEAGFTKAINIPIEELSGADRQNAQEAVDYLHRAALADGWRPTASGSQWYSRRYERQWDGHAYGNGLPVNQSPPARRRPAGWWVGFLGTVALFVYFCGVHPGNDGSTNPPFRSLLPFLAITLTMAIGAVFALVAIIRYRSMYKGLIMGPLMLLVGGGYSLALIAYGLGIIKATG